MPNALFLCHLSERSIVVFLKIGVYLYGSVLFFLVPVLLEEAAAPQKSVSSGVGAPCNVVSLCNRAGELG